MGKAVFEQLLADLAGLAAPDDSKQRFAELIRQSAARDGVTGLDRQERVQFARGALQRQRSGTAP